MSTDPIFEDAPDALATPDVDDAPDVIDTPDEPAAPAYDPDVEAQAREYGWKPESEWKGAPPKYGFVSPDEYLENPKVQTQIFRKERDAALARVEETKKEFDARLERMKAMQSEAEARRAENHRKEIERIKREQREAVEAMDTERWEALDAEREALGPAPTAEDAAKQDAPQAAIQPLPGEIEAVAAWRSKPENAWFYTDEQKRQAAIDAYTAAAMQGINDPNARLAFVEKRIGEIFPARPAQPQRAAAVDGGGLAGRQVSHVQRLPAEAREAMKRDIADGLFKDEKEWAEAYFAHEG